MSQTNQSDLNENVNLTIIHISKLQTVEEELYNKLKKVVANNGSNTEKKQIIDNISSISQLRTDLFKVIENAQHTIQNSVAQDTETLRDQLKAIKIMEKNLHEMKIRSDSVEDKNVDLERGVEISDYYGKKYSAQISTLKILILFCIPIIILNLIMKTELLPNIIYTFLLSFIILVGGFVIFNKWYDIQRRSTLDFDSFK